jgi:hypothetical protein
LSLSPGNLPAVRAIYAFAAWTVFVWATRVSNIVGGDGSTLDLALAVVLGALGAAVAVAAWRRQPAWPLAALVLGTVATWAVRTPLILLDAERAAGFKFVHLSLAVVSVTLAVAAWQARGSLSALGAARGIPVARTPRSE